MCRTVRHADASCSLSQFDPVQSTRRSPAAMSARGRVGQIVVSLEALVLVRPGHPEFPVSLTDDVHHQRRHDRDVGATGPAEHRERLATVPVTVAANPNSASGVQARPTPNPTAQKLPQYKKVKSPDNAKVCKVKKRKVVVKKAGVQNSSEGRRTRSY